MEITALEAAVCIKALAVAARAERKAGNGAEAEGFVEVREELSRRYFAGSRRATEVDQ